MGDLRFAYSDGVSRASVAARIIVSPQGSWKRTEVRKLVGPPAPYKVAIPLGGFSAYTSAALLASRLQACQLLCFLGIAEYAVNPCESSFRRRAGYSAEVVERRPTGRGLKFLAGSLGCS